MLSEAHFPVHDFALEFLLQEGSEDTNTVTYFHEILPKQTFDFRTRVRSTLLQHTSHNLANSSALRILLFDNIECPSAFSYQFFRATMSPLSGGEENYDTAVTKSDFLRIQELVLPKLNTLLESVE